MASPSRGAARAHGPLRRWLDHLPLGRKMALAFAVVLSFTAMLGASALVALERVNGASQALSQTWLPVVKDLAATRAAMLDARHFEVKHTQAIDDSYRAEYEDKRKEALAQASTGFAELDRSLGESEGAELRTKLRKHWETYLKFSDNVVKLSRSGKEADVMDARDISEGASKSESDDALVALDKLNTWAFEQGQQSAAKAGTLFAQVRLAVIALLLASLAIGATLAIALTRGLLRALGGEPAEARALVQSVAAGDLARHIPVQPGDQTSLMAALRDMQRSLAEVVQDVRQGADHVATASQQIAQGNSDLSTRTEMQASALQETSASMTELGATVTANAQHACEANDLARQAAEVASRGGDSVHQAVDSMRGINDSSRRIAEITSVIDGIAFQTNILALNAAVEAARAGEQGRGFAVVAAEVRSLAQRSATAAKEIKTLIQQTVEQIHHGTNQVDQAGATMAEVVRAIQGVSAIVHEISDASEQQRAGVTQVGDAIHHMDDTTQRNAALVEQSAAAAGSLQQEAGRLVEAVSRFRLHA
ncbi:MAG: hypothetical protein RI907_3632 [Pseudomonadota bacterium]|jgi:methyl-accepting chemotaxis protein